jgi:phage FluMu protein Com
MKMDAFQPISNKPHDDDEKPDFQSILSRRCPRCNGELEFHSSRPKVGAPDETIRCSSCGYTLDLSDAASFQVGETGVDLNLQPGWLTALQHGGLPNFSVRRKDGDEVPLSDWIRSASSVFRTCNLVIFFMILVVVIVVIFLQ